MEVHVAIPDVTGIGKQDNRADQNGVVWHDIPLSRTGMNPFADLLLLHVLYKLVRSVRPSIMLAYTAKPVIFGALAARLCGVPSINVLISGLGYAFTDRSGVLQLVLRALYKLSLRNVNRIFFQNPDDEQVFRELGVIGKQTPAVVIRGSGVNLSAYEASQVPESSARFLMIARLLGDKGVREYVSAARQMKKEFPETSFSLVGWIDENPDAVTLEELDEWISEGVIEFAGRVDDVRPELARCHVYVLPSYREGTPRTVLEAMSMGRAIITTDAPGCRETVIHGENGYLVPVKSVAGLIGAMQKFVCNPELAKSMGARSREVAEEHYDVRKVNDVMLREMGIEQTSKKM
jgi:glycosyltransferase involved in cell wall biosynthesis